jgi:hypothetical protein
MKFVLNKLKLTRNMKCSITTDNFHRQNESDPSAGSALSSLMLIVALGITLHQSVLLYQGQSL